MRMSVTKMASGVMRNATSFSTLRRPTNVSRARSRMAVTMASRMWCWRRARNVACTRSPSRAHMELRSATKTGCEPSSGTKLFLPLALRLNLPSCTCVLVLSR